MIKYSEPAQTPNLRRRNCTNQIIRFLTTKDDFGDSRWTRWVFYFGILTLLTAGATIYVPLMWLGVL